MLASIFNGFYTYGHEETVPFFTRIAVIVIIFAVLYDFFRRRFSSDIISGITSAGADSPENAVSSADLEKFGKGNARKCRFMLRETSPLRRYVMKTEDGRWYIPPVSDSGEEGIDAVMKNARRLPASLRGGAERSALKMVIGLVLLIIAGELFIRFFPVLYDHFIENSKNLFS